MNRIEDKIVVVTGGAAGIGLETAQLLSGEGAIVIIADLDVAAAEAAAQDIGGNTYGFSHDVREPPRWAMLLADITARWGCVDVLVNNAGIAIARAAEQDVESVTLSDWRAIHAVNLEGILLGCQAVMPVMRENGGGSIINIASVAGTLPTPTLAAYGASKAGVLQLTKSVALHCARRGDGIRCNAVLPGLIATGLFEQTFSVDERAEHLLSVPLGEFGTPLDVAHAVLYLASEESRHVTGARFVVDGGMTML